MPQAAKKDAQSQRAQDKESKRARGACLPSPQRHSRLTIKQVHCLVPSADGTSFCNRVVMGKVIMMPLLIAEITACFLLLITTIVFLQVKAEMRQNCSVFEVRTGVIFTCKKMLIQCAFPT